MGYVKLFLVALSLGGLLWAESPNDPPLRAVDLSDYKAVTVESMAVLVRMPIRCGPDGSMLFDLFHGGRAPRSDDYLMVVHPDGSVVKFSAPDMQKFDWLDFQFGQHGEIYALIDQQDDKTRMIRDWLLEYAKDGTYVSKFELDLPITSRHFAWLDPHTLIVSGPRIDPRAATTHPHPSVFPQATVLANQRGQYIKDVKTERPEKLNSSFLAPDNLPWGVELSDEQQKKLDEYNDSTWLSDIQTTLDGHAYFHQGETNYVSVVNPDGTVQKQMSLDPPEPYMHLLRVWVRDGLLLAWFQGESEKHVWESRYLLYDLATGKLWRHFRTDVPKLKTTPACVSRSSLTFLGANQGRMELDVVSIP